MLGPFRREAGGSWRAELESVDAFHDDVFYRVVLIDGEGPRTCFYVVVGAGAPPPHEVWLEKALRPHAEAGQANTDYLGSMLPRLKVRRVAKAATSGAWRSWLEEHAMAISRTTPLERSWTWTERPGWREGVERTPQGLHWYSRGPSRHEGAGASQTDEAFLATGPARGLRMPEPLLVELCAAVLHDARV